MKMDFRILSLLLLFNLIFGCGETKQKTRSEIYSEKTAELINDLLKEEENQICDCILEPNNQSMAQIYKSEVPAFEFENYIIEKFKLETTAGIDSLYGINEKLILNPDLITGGIKFVTQKEYDSIYNKYDFEDAREVLNETYPNLCYFTKPIFDRDFKNALFDIHYETSDLWTPPPKVKNIQGVWEYDRN
ncbi:hypothetical protein [Aequorivita vladivostokensis]|uniref:Lipoprotein n=1 Tax=Aequorivita vladivostokensis TaxID=171194 RepID=A0ABR5DIG5_9FLAO|nr:hypothetical protein [Aequorivita vladivostokensis]KJJ38568.1 hypothetical protein MB09_07710 [Aequorivita vladivostokensis]MBF29961.1 hypothetical protein [Aequorivita sp.]|tara:strand:- start:151384 stop:151953 length:570 start_codon:yes stop_codon:yes gene_type:complete